MAKSIIASETAVYPKTWHFHVVIDGKVDVTARMILVIRTTGGVCRPDNALVMMQLGGGAKRGR